MIIFRDFHTTPFVTEEARLAASQLPAAVRQAMVENLLYEYPQFENVTKGISKFHRPVDGGKHGTGWIAGLLGDSRAGKSFLLQAYAGQFQPALEDDGYHFPVVYIQARADWDLLEFGRQIYTATGASSVPRLSASALNTKAGNRLINHHVELLIIDDFQFVLEAAPHKMKSFLSLVKHVADLRSCNVLLSGLPQIEGGVVANLQVAGRGGFPKFRLDGHDPSIQEEQLKYRAFLKGVDNRLPFAESSELHAIAYQSDFLHLTGGSVGLTMNIVIDAAFKAVNEGERRIRRRHLREAAFVRMDAKARYLPFAGEEI